MVIDRTTVKTIIGSFFIFGIWINLVVGDRFIFSPDRSENRFGFFVIARYEAIIKNQNIATNSGNCKYKKSPNKWAS
jgi:hypothetical protein